MEYCYNSRLWRIANSLSDIKALEWEQYDNKIAVWTCWKKHFHKADKYEAITRNLASFERVMVARK